jgi:folate-binding protein YgfZ
MTNQFSLDHLRAVTLSGPDALAFANAQLTIDVDTLSDRVWRPAAWCEPKGRVVSTMMARTSEKDVELVLPAPLAETVSKRLELFTIGRDVKLSSPQELAGTFANPDSDPALSFDPQRGMAVTERPTADADQLSRWRRLDLCAGMPWLTPETSGQHLPQWLGLESLQALAFDKGCYPGQEVIARLHYRGTSKHRLLGLEIPSGPFDPAPQSRITDDSGRLVGHCLQVLDAHPDRIGLAVLSTAIEPGDDVVVNDEAGRRGVARVTAPDALC